MAKKNDYIEVKVYTNGIYPGKAKKIVEQGVKGVISGGSISDNAKAVFDKENVWHRENVEPKDLESTTTKTEKDK